MGWTPRFALLAVMAAAVSLAPASAAVATTFTNPGTITMSSGAAADATPYPSPIAVTGVPGPITDVNVRINGFSHAKPNDVAFVLVAPGDQALLAYDGAGGATAVTGLNVTLDDSASSVLPQSTALTSGSFRPAAYFPASNFGPPGPGTSYGNPGPILGGTATFASQFNGLQANGTWSLFVRDFATGSGGQFTNGWSLEIEPSPATQQPTTDPAADNTKKKQKCMKKRGKKRAAGSAKKKCKRKKRRK